MASIFSGRAGRLAGMWAANQATQGLGQISSTLEQAQQNAGQYLTSAYDTGRDVTGAGYIDQMDALAAAYGAAPGMLTAGQDQAQRELREGLRGAQEPVERARNAGLGELAGGRDAALGQLAGAAGDTRALYGQARGDLNNYYGQATGTLQGAAGAYDPLIQRGMAGYDMLGNSLGLNGAGGNAAAVAAFQQGPGYQWQVDQATGAAQRAANKVGGLYGGNTADAVARLGSNLANQEYGAWQNRLAPYQGAALAATTGKTQQLDELARVYGQQGTALAGLGQNELSALNTIYGRAADTYTNTGKQSADLWSTAGKQLGDYSQNTTQALANNELKTGAGLASLTTDEGRAYADTTGNYSKGLVDLASGYGGAMGNLITGTAGQIAQAQQAANNTVTQSGTQGLLAGQQASANTWGAILGGLTAGSKLAGSSSFGSLIGSLFK